MRRTLECSEEALVIFPGRDRLDSVCGGGMIVTESDEGGTSTAVETKEEKREKPARMAKDITPSRVTRMMEVKINQVRRVAKVNTPRFAYTAILLFQASCLEHARFDSTRSISLRRLVLECLKAKESSPRVGWQ